MRCFSERTRGANTCCDGIFEVSRRISFQESLLVNKPLTEITENGLYSDSMTNTVPSLLQSIQIHFYCCTCELMERQWRRSCIFSEPEEKGTKHALIDIQCTRIFLRETRFAICGNPSRMVFARRKCCTVSGIRHYWSFSFRNFSGTSFCHSFLRRTFSSGSI